MGIFNQNILNFLKTNWIVLLLAAVCIFGYFQFKKSVTTNVEQLHKLQSIHESELKKINEAHDEERKAHEANIASLQQDLMTAQKQYSDAIAALEVNKQKKIDKLIGDLGDNPVALAKKISEVTGFKLIIATEEESQ